MGTEPLITGVPGFDPLHDFEPYAYLVDVDGARVVLHTRGQAVMDTSRTPWPTREVWLDVEFGEVIGSSIGGEIFGQQNCIFRLSEHDLATATAREELREDLACFQDRHGEPLPPGTRVFVLDASLGLGGVIAARTIAFQERDSRWCPN